MKKFLCTIIILTILLISFVNANTTKEINMEIFITDNGDAKVTESWTYQSNQNTEFYHSYKNLGKSEILDLTVSDSKGNTYENIGKWNVNASFKDKAYKCGLNKISDGVEICWGLSEYGTRTYTAKYTITNFVVGLKDAQMTYWELIPGNREDSCPKVEITVRAFKKFEDTLDVWGYGNYGGLCYVKDGVIKMHQPSNGLGQNEYMTLLVKFPQDTFDVSVTYSKSFDEYLNKANEGTTKYVDDGSYVKKEPISPVVDDICRLLIFFTFITAGIFKISKLIAQNAGVSKEDNKRIRDAEYFRDIPCEGDIFKIFYIANKVNITMNKCDFLGALILKWIKEGEVSVEKRYSKILKRPQTTIVFNRETLGGFSHDFSDLEEEMYEYLYKASQDGVLEKKEMEKWVNKNYDKFFDWFKELMKVVENKLTNEDLIYIQEYGKTFKTRARKFRPQLVDEAIKISGLKKYLQDYTLIHDREAIEVQLFEDYLIFAQIVGIADKVMKEFEDLYPDLVEQTPYSSYETLMMVHVYSNHVATTASSAYNAAHSYSSGGGGFSSGGGGGGSFGGGGGAGSR